MMGRQAKLWILVDKQGIVDILPTRKLARMFSGGDLKLVPLALTAKQTATIASATK
jgi:hypothetical protein